MKQPTIAEILHLAADHCLWDGVGRIRGEDFSCYAITRAVGILAGPGVTRLDRLVKSIFAGLENMGLNCQSACEFSEFRYGPERQAARYNWLKFAALIAEEQSV